jgi:hypothetical protein
METELRLITGMRLGFEGPRATARTLMKEGDTHFVALSWSEHAPPRTYDEAYDRLVWTAHRWQHWLDHGEFPDHPAGRLMEVLRVEHEDPGGPTTWSQFPRWRGRSCSTNQPSPSLSSSSSVHRSPSRRARSAIRRVTAGSLSEQQRTGARGPHGQPG